MGLQKCGLNLNRVYKELQPHGTLEFPCAGYSSHYTDSTEHIIPWHWHEEIEIVYLETGKLKLQIQGKTFHLKKGEGFIINSNILHWAVAEPRCELHSLVFSPLFITGDNASIFANRYITPLIDCISFDGCLLNTITKGNLSPTNEFVCAFEALSLDTLGYEFIIREKLSNICFSLYQHYEHKIEAGYTEPDQDSVRMRKMLDYIHNNFSEHLELSQIAKASDIGERECLRCFQRTIQVSPMQYLLKYRVTQGASMLLRNLNSSISDISSQCGFDSPSNFSQIFKRFFKCTPRDYKKKNHECGK